MQYNEAGYLTVCEDYCCIKKLREKVKNPLQGKLCHLWMKNNFIQ